MLLSYLMFSQRYEMLVSSKYLAMQTCLINIEIHLRLYCGWVLVVKLFEMCNPRLRTSVVASIRVFMYYVLNRPITSEGEY